MNSHDTKGHWSSWKGAILENKKEPKKSDLKEEEEERESICWHLIRVSKEKTFFKENVKDSIIGFV